MLVNQNKMSEQLDKVFGRYSVLDVASSLFTSSLWLPNIASPIKHSYLATVFASVNPKFFSKENQIKSYEDFKKFCETLYEAIPNFPIMEDYVPEIDWGDVKFHHRKKNYRIFYGGEVENIYDYLELFRVLYGEYDKECTDIIGRSPMDELEMCLMLQDYIITSIKTQPNPDSVDIAPGHIEVPSEEFWKETSKFYSDFKPAGCMKKFADQMSADSGIMPEELLQKEKFERAVFTEKLLPYMFLRAENRFYPILPRRFSYIFFNQWGSIISKFRDEIDSENSYTMKISGGVYKFIRQRFNEKDYFPFIQALTATDELHEILFSLGFISGDRIILVYILPPGVNVSEHLEEVTPKIKEALSLIGNEPNRFVLRSRNKLVQSPQPVKPELLIVIPLISTEMTLIDFPPELPGKIILLDKFLGLMDEIEDADELDDFLDFLDETEGILDNFILSLLDKYAAYKRTSGVLIEGAIEPDFVMLDPHGGSYYRFCSLKEFWEKYPDIEFFDHPRSWRVTRETNSRIGLEPKSFPGRIICCCVGDTKVSLTAPFDKLVHQEGLVANVLMECLEDNLQRYEKIKEFRFFRTFDRLHVIFLPSSLVGREEFKGLQSLDPGENRWKSEIWRDKTGFIEVRVVFNMDRVKEDLTGVADRRIETELLKEILFLLDRIIPDQNLPILEADVNTSTGQLPRFGIFQKEKPAAFPELIQPYKPRPTNFRAARKRIAQLAKEAEFVEGNYAHEEAKIKLNALKTALVAEINKEVKTLDYAKTLPFLIAQIDALTNEIQLQKIRSEEAESFEVDHDRAAILNIKEKEYIRHYRSCQYLIEKLVQLRPEGKEELNNKKCAYLMSFVEGLRAFQDASDYLHYGVAEMGMSVSRDLIVEVHQEDGMKEKVENLGEERMQIKLGQIGNSDDRILFSTGSLESFQNLLNRAFLEDFGFEFENMVKVLRILSFWPGYRNETKEAAFYSATLEQMTETFLLEIPDLTRERVQSIIGFLTLRSEDILRVLDQVEECSDIPVWEINKRPARYTLRPFVLIGGQYYWGAYSARKSCIIWSESIESASMPVDLRSCAIQAVLDKRKIQIGNTLTDKTYEIVSRRTPYTRKNAELHKIDRRTGHPQELGDYDNLAFFPQENIVLNIECKSIPQARCIKDAKRLRERIFGRNDDEKDGYFGRVEVRHKYLQDKMKSVADSLGWQLDPKSLPRVIAVFLTQHSDWWTKYPPKEVDAEFVQIELLETFIEKL